MLTTSLALVALSLAWAPFFAPRDLDNRAAVAAAIQSTDADAHEAAILMRIAWKESRYRRHVARCSGSRGGLWQVEGRNDRELRTACSADYDAQATLALERVRESRAACAHLPPAESLAVYTSGKCSSKKGRALSRERWAEI